VKHDSSLVLSGDDLTPAIALKESDVNHLRRLLAWLKCEYMLDEDSQRGFVIGLTTARRHGLVAESVVRDVVDEECARIDQCPKYVRQAVKMLTKALRDHEHRSGIVDGVVR
jgi:hypothetical protein